MLPLLPKLRVSDKMARITKKKFKKACEGSGGVGTLVAKSIGVTRQAIYVYLKRHPEMRVFIDEEGEKILDVAEHNTDKEIMAGNVDVGHWALLNRKKGKARGYGPKQEFDIQDDKTRIQILKADNENNKVETKLKTGTGTGSSK